MLAMTTILSLAACGEDTAQHQAGRDSHAVSDTAHAGAPGDSAAHGHGAEANEGETLLVIMQRLGGNMTALTHALMTDDHRTVRVQAAAIAQHAPIATHDLERIRTALGPEMTRFEAVDESVHVASVQLHDAADAGNTDAVLTSLGRVQRGCVSCHAQFRERLRTNR
jgi:cytochrome c556